MSAKVTTAVSNIIRAEGLVEAEGVFSAEDEGGIGQVDMNGSFRHLSIRKTEKRVHKFLWFSWTRNHVFFVGELWLQNPNLGAHNKNWILHVYGERFMDELIGIANSITRDLGVSIHVRLERKEVCDITPEPWWVPAPHF